MATYTPDSILEKKQQFRKKHFCIPFNFHGNTNMQLIKTLLKCNMPVNLKGLTSLILFDYWR